MEHIHLLIGRCDKKVLMNYQDILNRFSYDDETKIIDRISKAEKEDYRENQDIINEIVLWKLNRRPQINEKVIEAIYKLEVIKTPIEAIDSELTRDVLMLLLNSRGMKLPMASTVLHFYYPDIFPIIDQRAYRELYGKEYPNTKGKNQKLIDLYVQYIIDCNNFHQEMCPEIPFSKLDKILYQIDKEKGNHVKY